MSLCKTCFHGDWARDIPMRLSEKDVCKACVFLDAEQTRASNWKPISQTNADRIRAMSDEELAEKMHCPYIEDVYGECKFGWHTPTQTCFECKLEWLKQPVKDGDNDG